MPLFDANGDSTVYFTVNLNKKYVIVGLVLHPLLSIIKLILLLMNSIILSFSGILVQHCFSHPCYKLVCFPDNILFDALLTKCFGYQSKKVFDRLKSRWTWWYFRYKCTNIFQSLQALFGILREGSHPLKLFDQMNQCFY